MQLLSLKVSGNGRTLAKAIWNWNFEFELVKHEKIAFETRNPQPKM